MVGGLSGCLAVHLPETEESTPPSAEPTPEPTPTPTPEPIETGFTLEPGEIYSIDIYLDSGDCIKGTWKASHSIWWWYTNAYGSAEPARDYSDALPEGLRVSGIREPHSLYPGNPDTPQLRISGPEGYIGDEQLEGRQGDEINICADKLGYYSLRFYTDWAPESLMTVKMHYWIEK